MFSGGSNPPLPANDAHCRRNELNSPVYDAEMRKSFGLGFHPNPMGYYAYALIVGNYIDYIIRSNPQEFATIPFVGTLLKNKDYK